MRESKATHPAYNRCPINFVVGGLPLTATITVVKGCWRPPRKDVRARSFSSFSLSDATLYQHYRQPALSFIYRVRCLSVSLFLFVGLFLLIFFSLFLPDLQPSLVATHYIRTTDVHSLEISLFVSVEMQRRIFSLFLVLCSLGTVVVGDVVLAVEILVMHEISTARHSIAKNESWRI